jgi:RNA polymerase sigma factor (sigma-70 family)
MTKAERQRATEMGNERLTEDQKRVASEFMERYPLPVKALLRAHRSTYNRAVAIGLSNEDINQICCMGILRATRTWQTGKSSFDTYAIWKMWGEVSRLCSHLCRQLRNPSGIVFPLSDELPTPKKDEPFDVSQIGRYLSLVTKRERKFIELRYGIGGEPLKLHEVGEAMGVTRERVRQVIGRAIYKIRERAL